MVYIYLKSLHSLAAMVTGWDCPTNLCWDIKEKGKTQARVDVLNDMVLCGHLPSTSTAFH